MTCMKTIALALLCLPCLVARAEWKSFSPRAEIAPVCELKAKAGRNGGQALHISSGGNAAAFGGWKREFKDISGGQNYQFTAWYRAKKVENDRRSVIARLEWLDDRSEEHTSELQSQSNLVCRL